MLLNVAMSIKICKINNLLSYETKVIRLLEGFYQMTKRFRL